MKTIHKMLTGLSGALRRHGSASPEEREKRARRKLDLKVKLARMRSL